MNTGRRLRIVLVVVLKSPFNRSIWTGIGEGLASLGHDVQVVDYTQVPDPEKISGQVDLVFAVHGYHVPLDKIRGYRDRGIVTAVYLLDEPYEVDRTEEWARNYDYVFSVDRVTVPIHEQHTNAAFLPLAYNEAVFGPDGPNISSRILVLGTPFSAREPYLEALRERWGKLVTWVGPGWKEFSAEGAHYEHYVAPPECAKFYRGADITINIHRDSTWSHFGELNTRRLEATHLNPRFWETAACGSLPLCSYRDDLDVFAPNCPSFSTVDEFVSKMDYFLGNEKSRKSRAGDVFRKVKKHGYRKRCETILRELSLCQDLSDKC